MDRALSAAAGGRTRFLTGLVAVGVLTALVVLVAEPVLAKRMVGTNGADKIVGTAKPDRIKARGGNDRVKGLGGGDRLKGSKGKDRIKGGKGKDRIEGGKGRDRLKGSKGKDRIKGGKGADRLRAFDNRKDSVVNGGAGNDRCTIDQADLSGLRNCEEAKVRDGGPGGGPDEDELRVTNASGLTCDSSLPTCLFQIEGDRADALTGTVTGGGGVTPAAGAGVAVTGESWTAAGLYGCTSDGYLEVTIGSRSVRVPITCTT
jgi:Ca2+-binding RTX toxin-like protein